MLSVRDLRRTGGKSCGLPARGAPAGLPLERLQTGCNEGSGGPGSKCAAHVIAVVDDDEGFRDALQLFLRTFAFQVAAFRSGEEFLRSRRLGEVGCVILDLAMPGMDGLEVQQQLAVQGLQIPIVFVTANRDDYLERCASAAGALAVLRKPPNDEELVRLVRGALEGTDGGLQA